MFKEYRRKQVAELREVRALESLETLKAEGISVSHEDVVAGSPKEGDMIARNPKNHKDKWLVAKQYFNDNFELI